MQPLEYIRGLLGEDVTVVLRDRSEVKGTLHMFDEHVNLVLSNASGVREHRGGALFLRGENIFFVSEAEASLR